MPRELIITSRKYWDTTSHMCSKAYNLFSITDYIVLTNTVSSFPSFGSEKSGAI
jgi:hypothetical protein